MLLITNDGIFSETWDTVLDSKKITTPIDKTINHYYADTVLFSDDLTIGGFFNTLYKYKTFIEDDFVSYTSCTDIQPFYDRLNQPIDRYIQMHLPAYIFKGIVIKHSASITTHQIQGEQRNYVNSWNHLVGFDNTHTQPILGITLEHVNCIRDLPLKLDMFYNLIQINPYDKDIVLATKLVNHFTFHDILSTMFYELTFIDALDENEDLREIKTVEELMHEDIVRRIRDAKQKLEIAKRQEQYEKCHVLQTEINRLETELRSAK